jgi:hypothetical protein
MYLDVRDAGTPSPVKNKCGNIFAKVPRLSKNHVSGVDDTFALIGPELRFLFAPVWRTAEHLV